MKLDDVIPHKSESDQIDYTNLHMSCTHQMDVIRQFLHGLLKRPDILVVPHSLPTDYKVHQKQKSDAPNTIALHWRDLGANHALLIPKNDHVLISNVWKKLDRLALLNTIVKDYDRKRYEIKGLF